VLFRSLHSFERQVLLLTEPTKMSDGPEYYRNKIETELEKAEPNEKKLDFWQRQLDKLEIQTPYQASAQDYESMGRAFAKALREEAADKADQSVIISEATETRVNTYLKKKGFVVLVDAPEIQADYFDKEFQPFQWTRSEPDDTPAAMVHLQTQLQEFGLQFGRGHFSLYDVHAIRSFLSFDDERSGKISGGTDLVIAPYGFSVGSLNVAACIVIELKTFSAADSGCFGKYKNQALLELIAANYHSNQLCCVVLTDLVSGAKLFTYALENDDVVIIESDVVSLSAMAAFIISHLNHCSTSRTYKWKDIQDHTASVPERIIKISKKRMISDLNDQFDRGDFRELIYDLKFDSSERYHALAMINSRAIPDMIYS